MEHKKRTPVIIHKPLGNEQPYFQKVYERFPRYPIAGEPVTVGCVVDEVPAEVMVLEWSVDSWDSVNSVPALCVGNTDSVGHAGHEHFWLATIPGTDEAVVSYRFRAYSGSEEVISDSFFIRMAEKIVCDCCTLAVEKSAVRVTLYSSLTAAAVILRFTADTSADTSTDGSVDISANSSADSSADSSTDSSTDVRMEITIDDDYYVENSTIDHSKLGDLEIALQDDGFTLTDIASGNVLLDCTGCHIVEQYDCAEQQVQLQFSSGDSERFYGFGERYNGLNQRGQILQNRVFEQYKNQQLKSYMPVPFFFTSTGRGIYTADDHRIDYDLCASDNTSFTVNWYLGKNDTVLNHLYSGSPLEMIRAYARDTSLPVMPPEWVFGPWMSSNEWNSQERVLFEAEKSAELDIPATVLVIEAWSDETTFYIWNGAEYAVKDPAQKFELGDFSFSASEYWNDPKAMSDRLHELGMKLVLWQIPVIKASGVENEQHRLDWDHAEKQDLIVREADGTPHHSRPGWFQGSLLPDFANPEAAEWWFRKREYLVRECGVDGFKTDGGEQLWGESTRFGNGKTGAEMLNRFPVEYLKAYHEFLDRELDGAGATFSRSGYRGIQRYPVHWAGDQGSTWEAYRGVLPAALNAGLSGIPFVGWDIGGFSGEIPTSELYLRSAATAVFSSIMQYHSEYHDHTTPHVDRTPWNIAECNGTPEVIDIYRLFAKLRMALLPYIMQEAEYCCSCGEPLMRPLLLDYPADEQACGIEDQYLFGRSLLVAPLLYEGETAREVYLPKGDWIDAWSGKHVSGGCTITYDAPLDIIPLYRNLSVEWPLDEDIFMRFRRDFGIGRA